MTSNTKSFTKSSSVDENFLKKWMFFNCPKQFSWIIYQNLNSIIQNTVRKSYPSITKTDVFNFTTKDIIYVHSVSMTNTQLLCLLETKDGFFFINNNKIVEQKESKDTNDTNDIKESTTDITNETETKNEKVHIDIKQIKTDETTVKVDSTTTFYDRLNLFLVHTPRSILNKMGINKITNMKLTADQKLRNLFPFQYKLYDNPYDILDEEIKQSPVLDLSWNFCITSDHLTHWKPSGKLDKLIFNTCYQIRDFKWIKTNWVNSLSTIEFINMSQLTNNNIEFIVSNLPLLKELYLHYCPQINIRVILHALKNTSVANQLEVLCLDDPNMSCQPNEYSGLITEDEWEIFKNYNLKKLFINSTNLSLDIIDSLKTHCIALEKLIIDDSIYNSLKKSIVPGHSEKKLILTSTANKMIEIPKDSIIRNLLKHKFQKPFSDSMLDIMNRIYKEENPDSETSENTIQINSCNKN